MDKYIAILGGNQLACPAIEHLGDLGYKTLVLDRNPDSPGKAVATTFLAADFADYETAQKVIKDYDLAAILAISDFGVRTAARLSEELGLPGYSWQSALNVTNKVYMKQRWMAEGLLTPKFAHNKLSRILAGERIEWDTFPCIVKPAFSGGGSRGVALVNNHDDVIKELQSSQTVYIDDDIILEEFIDGTEHTLEVLIHNGETHLLSISDKKNYEDSISVVQDLYFPGQVGWRHGERLRDLMDRACRALGLENGCAHFEVLISGDDIYLLEVGGRPGGGINFFPICTLSTGYDYPRELVRILSGEVPSMARADKTFQLGWHFFNTGNGRLVNVRGFDEVKAHPNVVDAQLYARVGEDLPNRSNDLARPGYFLVKGRDMQEVNRIIDELKQRVVFEVE